MADADSESGGLTRALKDLFAGAAGGVAQVLLGQPFDIVKVRLQTTKDYTNALDAATKIYKNEGPLAFYKGTLTPLIGIGACVSVQFTAFHFARRHFETLNSPSSSPHSPSPSHLPSPAPPLTYTQYYLSGAIAGLTNTLLSSPIEHIRIRLQTQPHSPPLYTGPLDLISQLTRSQGLVSRTGLYRATGVTALRETQAYGLWFLTFEYLMQGEVSRRQRQPPPTTPGAKPFERKDIPAWKVALFGGLAGEALWIGSYPFDVVKSKMQSDGFGTGQRYSSARDCARQTWRAEGVGGFWRGVGPTLLRAMPVSAGTFAVVEMTMRAIS